MSERERETECVFLHCVIILNQSFGVSFQGENRYVGRGDRY